MCIRDSDKAMAVPQKYTKENIIEYELMTRDSRIGEITNAATSIENRYVTEEEVKTLFSDYSSLLRILQGKEIDYLKTGLRWNIPQKIKRQSKQLPYFLLYNYPQKMKTYQTLAEKNKAIPDKKNKVKLNAYHSPSPLNELCDYICTWEKKHILWTNQIEGLMDSRCLVVDNTLNLTNRAVIRVCRRYINDFAQELKRHMNLKSENPDDKDYNFRLETISEEFKSKLLCELALPEETVANYVISCSYTSMSISKSLAWSAFGNYILRCV